MNDRFEGAIVEVVAGQEQKTYQVHENLLRANSGFFDAALKKEWKEGNSRKVTLPEEQPEMMYRYIMYLYTGLIVCNCESRMKKYLLLANLFVLGERMLDDSYKDKVLDKMDELACLDLDTESNWAIFPGIVAVNVVYSKTPVTSPMCCFLVDLYVLHASEKFEYTHEEDGEVVPAHPEFLLDLVKAMSLKRSPEGFGIETVQKSLSAASCAHHHHEDGAACRASGRRC